MSRRNFFIGEKHKNTKTQKHVKRVQKVQKSEKHFSSLGLSDKGSLLKIVAGTWVLATDFLCPSGVCRSMATLSQAKDEVWAKKFGSGAENFVSLQCQKVNSSFFHNKR